MWDTIIILEERKLFHPCFPDCDMFVLCKALKWRQTSTTMCTQVQERKFKRLAEEEAQSGAELVVLQAYGHPLSVLASFKDLSGFLTVADDEWASVITNLRKARKWWA